MKRIITNRIALILSLGVMLAAGIGASQEPVTAGALSEHQGQTESRITPGNVAPAEKNEVRENPGSLSAVHLSDRSDVSEPDAFNEVGFVLKNLASVFLGIGLILLVTWLAIGRPTKPNIRRTLFLAGCTITLLIIAIVAFAGLLVRQDRAHAVQDQRMHESLELANELKQSSDDLTHFARMYAETGDPQYEGYFRAIAAIRDGKQPHPANFTRSYWDLVAGGFLTLTRDGETYSIEERLIQLGLTKEEETLLLRAKQESDDLINLEDVAMNAVKGLYKDEQGRFTVRGAPDLELARAIVHGQNYHQAKAKIMEPIDQFFSLLKWRIDHEWKAARERNKAIVLIVTLLSASTVGFAVYVFSFLKRRILSPLALFEGAAHRIEEGDYSGSVNLDSEDEVGQLASAFNAMIEKIHDRTSSLNQAQSLAKMGNWDLDFSTGKMTWSDEIYHIYGLRPEACEPIYEVLLGIIHPDDLEFFESKFAIMAGGNQDGAVVEHRIIRKDTHEVRYLHHHYEYLRDSSGRILKAVGVTQDITERKLQEQQMYRQNQRLRTLQQVLAHPERSEEDVLNGFIRESCHLLEMDRAYIGRVEGSRRMVEHAFPVEGMPEVGASHELDSVCCGLPFKVQGTVLEHDLASSAYRDSACCQRGFKAYAGTLIRTRRGTYGVLSFTRKTPRELPFDEQDRNFIEVIAEIVGATLDRLMSHQELARTAEELRLFNQAMIARETRMIDLKKQINTLSEALGRPVPYAAVSEIDDGEPDKGDV